MPDILRLGKDALHKAEQIIEKGGIVILPTDTVYGLAGNAYRYDVFTKISDLKNRPRGKPFPVHVGKREDVPYLSEGINLVAMFLMKALWPGALTIVFEAQKDLPEFLKSPDGKIGIRVSGYEPLRELLTQLSLPLIVTSANKSGGTSPNSLEGIEESVKEGVDLILDGGKTSLEKDSTVVDVTADLPVILREGAIEKERLKEVLSLKKIIFVCTGNSCRSVMAKYYLEKLFKERGIAGIEIDSAGTGTFPGLEASVMTLEVLKEEGIDASSHRAKPINRKLIIENDLIVVMGQMHRQFLEEKFPESRGKIRLLGDFFKEKGLSAEISDPIGQTKDVYKVCLFRIKMGLEALAKEVVQLKNAFI